MKVIIIIISSGFLLWCIARIISAINNFVITLKEMPENYDLKKRLSDKRMELSNKEYELYLLNKKYSELEERWQAIRKRKEELRHENRALKKLNHPTP